jgi:hypothetical protein
MRNIKKLNNTNAALRYFALIPLSLLLVSGLHAASVSTAIVSGKENVADTTRKDVSGNGYNHAYYVNAGYSAEGKKAIEETNAQRNAAIIAGMMKDKLVTDSSNLSFKISNDAFIVNGVKQTSEIFERYKKEYVPKTLQAGEWSWTYRINQPVK